MAQEQPVSLSELMSSSYRMRRVMRFVSRSPRCKLCNVPFAGPGRVFRLAGFGQSRKNPNMCTACFERSPLGGAEIGKSTPVAAHLIEVGSSLMTAPR